MSTITCPNCGNSLPEGSAFCNKCGSPIPQASTSHSNQDDDWKSERTSKLEQRSQKNKSNNNLLKYIIIGVAVAAFGILFYITRCSSKSEKNPQAVSIIDDSAAACADTLSRALNDYNYVSDGARIVYALRANGSQPGVNDVIIGITQLTSKADDSFYKIYKLVKTNGKWTIDPEHIKKISTAGYDVTFDQNKLRAGHDIIPQMVEIAGKKYFFYAFMQNPTGDLSRAQVVMNMYDVESRAVTTATYEGAFENINGEQRIVCSPASSSSEVVKWMNETARNFIRIIYFKGEEQADRKSVV